MVRFASFVTLLLVSISLTSAQENPPKLIDRVSLEMSLKPFRSMDDATIRKVCEEVFTQWAPLIRQAGGSSVMLWTADGSEILDYRGKLEDEIEWAKWIGIGNPRPKASPGDPQRKALHTTPHLYMENPPKVTYADLKRIVRCLREVGEKKTGKPVTIGATFDPGPEFAKSSFKYERHPEISVGDIMGANEWVACNVKLKGDKTAYAGFPDGIPDGITLGAFLGRQSKHFLTDMGFDYLWLSNGFGFSVSAWNTKGPAFNGEKFDTAKAKQISDEILTFWKDFRKECPQFPLETRGSNLTTGTDTAAAGSPLRDIYRSGFNMVTPPNSPWAALDGDFGLELVGYLSRIAELPPGENFPFRYYAHDPWWLNSPWFDRYGREPHDIYLPLALARIDGAGKVTRPTDLRILTIDDSYGRMPVEGPIEMIPHLLAGLRHYSDAPGLVTWIYPFDEIHDRAFGEKGEPRPAEGFFGDWLMRSAVARGFPLSSVVSTQNFLRSGKANPQLYRSTVLLAPVPDGGSELEKTLLAQHAQGQDILLYGPVDHAGDSLLAALNLQRTSPLDGELLVQTSLPADRLLNGAVSEKLLHRNLLSAGGIDTVLKSESEKSVEVCATVAGKQPSEKRVYAVLRAPATSAGQKAGQLAWVRGSFCNSLKGRLPMPDDANKNFPAEVLLRGMLAKMGQVIFFEKPTVATKDPLVLVSRQKNGFYFSGYCPSTAVKISMRLAHGAPLLVGAETFHENGRSHYTMPRAWHKEVRVLVDQKESAELSCLERYSGHVGISRRLHVTGLKNATVTFYPENPAEARRVIMAVNNLAPHNDKSIDFAVEDGGQRLVAKDITGQLLISW